MKISLYCTCGAAASGSMPESAAAKMKALWETTHQGAGHEPCDAATARRKRSADDRRQGSEDRS